jgi:hypothetical protein
MPIWALVAPATPRYAAPMPTLVMDPAPIEIGALIERRPRLGLVTDRDDWLALTDGEYRPVERNTLIDLGSAELAGLIRPARMTTNMQPTDRVAAL